MPFAGWEMPVQYEGIRAEHLAVRERAGVFDVSHMGEIETSGPDAEAFLQRVLSNDVAKLADGGAQYSVLCQEDGGVLDDLFSYRLGDRFLTVTNASNHERDLAWFRKHAEGFDVELADRLHDLAMLAVQGPEARGIVAGLADGELPKRFKTATLTVAGQDGVLVCGTGYTGEDGVELIVPAAAAPAVWDAVVDAGRAARRARRARHAAPGGLLPPLRQRPDDHPRPDRGRPGLVLQGGHGLHRLRRRARRARGRTRREARAVRAHRLRDRPPGQPGRRRRRGDLGHDVPEPGLRDRHGLPAGRERAEPGTEIEIDVRGKVRTAEVREKPLYTKET